MTTYADELATAIANAVLHGEVGEVGLAAWLEGREVARGLADQMDRLADILGGDRRRAADWVRDELAASGDAGNVAAYAGGDDSFIVDVYGLGRVVFGFDPADGAAVSERHYVAGARAGVTGFVSERQEDELFSIVDAFYGGEGANAPAWAVEAGRKARAFIWDLAGWR